MSSEDYSFEIAFYERLDSREKNDPRVMELLAQLYTSAGRNEEGLSVDLRLSKKRPNDPLVHYNLACSFALTGQSEASMNTLKRAVKMGYNDFDWMLKDADLDPIRNLPSYREWIAAIGISDN